MIKTQNKYTSYGFAYYDAVDGFQKTIEIVAEDYFTAYRTFRDTHKNVKLWSVTKQK